MEQNKTTLSFSKPEGIEAPLTALLRTEARKLERCPSWPCSLRSHHRPDCPEGGDPGDEGRVLTKKAFSGGHSDPPGKLVLSSGTFKGERGQWFEMNGVNIVESGIIGFYGTWRHEKSPVLRGLHSFTGLSWTVQNHQMVGRRQFNHNNNIVNL